MSAACMPPAPPNEKRAKSRGSKPRSMEMTRMAFSMLALAMSTMPWAVASMDFPIRAATRETAARLRAAEIFIAPPRK